MLYTPSCSPPGGKQQEENSKLQNWQRKVSTVRRGIEHEGKWDCYRSCHELLYRFDQNSPTWHMQNFTMWPWHELLNSQTCYGNQIATTNVISNWSSVPSCSLELECSTVWLRLQYHWVYTPEQKLLFGPACLRGARHNFVTDIIAAGIAAVQPLTYQ